MHLGLQWLLPSACFRMAVRQHGREGRHVRHVRHEGTGGKEQGARSKELRTTVPWRQKVHEVREVRNVHELRALKPSFRRSKATVSDGQQADRETGWTQGQKATTG